MKKLLVLLVLATGSLCARTTTVWHQDGTYDTINENAFGNGGTVWHSDGSYDTFHTNPY